MKIRTQQYLNACIAGVLVLLIGATLAVSSHRLSNAAARDDVSTDILLAISQMRLVMFEYVLSHSERPRAQWQQRHASLARLLATELYDGTSAQALIGRVRERHRQLSAVFAELVQSYAMSGTNAEEIAVSQRLEAQLVADLLEATQDMVANISRVHNATGAEVASAQRWESLLLAAFVALMGAMVVINVLLTRTQVLLPIAKLEAGTARVGAGDLAFRTGLALDNELGELSSAFDRMAAQMQKSRAEIDYRVAQLEAANRELEAFSYSASHDLRQPLQTIDGFSRALLEDYGDKLDPEARDYLQRLRAASQHLAQLVDDLLKLARLTRADMALEPVDLGALARAVADELRAQDPRREVGFDIAAGAMVQGDRRLLTVLMQNLLGNAWKFTSKHPHAKIAFGVAQHDGERVYYVRDDGAGFDLARVDKLFVPFQRLHTTSDFPGAGIGLATVRRIVVRHGGRVWAEGAPEQGATFYFTLPGVPDAA